MPDLSFETEVRTYYCNRHFCFCKYIVVVNLNLLRSYQGKSNKVELLFEIDKEFEDFFKKETDGLEPTEENLTKFINERIKDSLGSN